MKGRQKLLLRLVPDIQAEHIAGLDAVEVLIAGVVDIAQGLHGPDKRLVRGGNIRIQPQRIGAALLCQLRRGLGQLLQGLPVMHIAHRAPGGIHHAVGHAGHFADEDAHGAGDPSGLVPAEDSSPLPVAFHRSPQMGLEKMALGMPLHKGFILG